MCPSATRVHPDCTTFLSSFGSPLHEMADFGFHLKPHARLRDGQNLSSTLSQVTGNYLDPSCSLCDAMTSGDVEFAEMISIARRTEALHSRIPRADSPRFSSLTNNEAEDAEPLGLAPVSRSDTPLADLPHFPSWTDNRAEDADVAKITGIIRRTTSSDTSSLGASPPHQPIWANNTEADTIERMRQLDAYYAEAPTGYPPPSATLTCSELRSITSNESLPMRSTQPAASHPFFFPPWPQEEQAAATLSHSLLIDNHRLFSTAHNSSGGANPLFLILNPKSACVAAAAAAAAAAAVAAPATALPTPPLSPILPYLGPPETFLVRPAPEILARVTLRLNKKKDNSNSNSNPSSSSSSSVSVSVSITGQRALRLRDFPDQESSGLRVRSFQKVVAELRRGRGHPCPVDFSPAVQSRFVGAAAAAEEKRMMVREMWVGLYRDGLGRFLANDPERLLFIVWLE